MSEEMRVALGILNFYLERDLAPKTSQALRLELERDGYSASALGWRFIATGQGDETQIVSMIETATENLMRHERQPKGTHLSVVPDPADDEIVRRFYEREPASLTLRHFVEQAVDAGEINRRLTIDVHVNRLQRRIDRE